MKVGPSIVDYMTGMNTSIGILSALYHRKANGGEGQHVDVCLFDTVIASLSHWLQIYLVNGKTPPRRGTWGNGGMPAGVFRCTDGELMLVVGNDGQFARTCAVLGAPELATDPNFVKNNDRVVHGKEIMAIFAGLFLKKPVAYWLDELEKAGVPSGPINDFEQVFADPHVQLARHADQGRSSLRAGAVADPQRHHLLRHPGQGLSRAAAARRATPRKCWRRSAMTTPRLEALKEQKIV